MLIDTVTDALASAVAGLGLWEVLLDVGDLGIEGMLMEAFEVELASGYRITLVALAVAAALVPAKTLMGFVRRLRAGGARS